MLYVLFVWALRLCKPRLRDSWLVGAFGAFYVAVAIPLAYKLQTNYGNFLESKIPFVEKFRLSQGQVKYTILIALAYTVGIVLGSFIYIGISKLSTVRFRKRTKS